jgi:hypothetical protein
MTGVDLDGQRKIFLVGFLNHPWDPDEIRLLGERKTSDNRGTCQNEDVNVLMQQIGSNCHGPPYVAQTIGVMGVHQDIIRCRFSFHSMFRSTELCDGIKITLRAIFYKLGKNASPFRRRSLKSPLPSHLTESLMCEEKEMDSLFVAKLLSDLKHEPIIRKAAHIIFTVTFQGKNLS